MSPFLQGKVSQIHLGATFLLGRKTIGPGNNGFFDEFALQGHYLLGEGRL